MKIQIIFAALVLMATAFGQSTSPVARTKKLKVLTATETDPGRLLPPPPVDGSASHQKEWAEVVTLVKTRTKERLAQAMWDNDHEDASAFTAVIGPAFDLEKLPVTAKPN